MSKADQLHANPNIPNTSDNLGMRALEHAVGLLVLGSFPENDELTRTKLALTVLLAANNVDVDEGKTKIDMISDAKSRVISRMIQIEPDIYQNIAHRRLKLKKVQKNWTEWTRLAYSKVLFYGEPRGRIEVSEIQKAILENEVDFRLDESDDQVKTVS